MLGYRVVLNNSTADFKRNVSVLGSTKLGITFGELEIWTNYSVQVCAFNSKGNGPWSASLMGTTDEEGT